MKKQITAILGAMIISTGICACTAPAEKAEETASKTAKNIAEDTNQKAQSATNKIKSEEEQKTEAFKKEYEKKKVKLNDMAIRIDEIGEIKLKEYAVMPSKFDDSKEVLVLKYDYTNLKENREISAMSFSNQNIAFKQSDKVLSNTVCYMDKGFGDLYKTGETHEITVAYDLIDDTPVTIKTRLEKPEQSFTIELD